MYNINSKLNNINKNIKILEYSNLNNNFLILASHSGTNYNAYFNNLIKLNKDDLIYIKYNNFIYTYKIYNIYYIKKTGYLDVKKDLSNTLILITCSTREKDKQLIIMSTIIDTKEV